MAGSSTNADGPLPDSGGTAYEIIDVAGSPQWLTLQKAIVEQKTRASHRNLLAHHASQCCQAGVLVSHRGSESSSCGDSSSGVLLLIAVEEAIAVVVVATHGSGNHCSKT